MSDASHCSVRHELGLSECQAVLTEVLREEGGEDTESSSGVSQVTWVWDDSDMFLLQSHVFKMREEEQTDKVWITFQSDK